MAALIFSVPQAMTNISICEELFSKTLIKKIDTAIQNTKPVYYNMAFVYLVGPGLHVVSR